MLTREDNDLLCRVGPGTPMGELMRQFWIPALLTSELPDPDGTQTRVRLLGEDLVAFRDTNGAVALVDSHCPHRGASLFFGRNEECGIRCVYHGWKFDVTGKCVDMPNEPPESNFKEKIRLKAYRCQERNGIIWTYMGPRSVPPPLPDIEPNMQPEGEYQNQKVFRECNWAQGLEGDIDTSHLGFLHLGSVTPESTEPGSFDYYTVKDRQPRYEVMATEYGTMYAAYRPAETDTYYWRFAQFLFPFFSMIPTGVLGVQVLVRAWVPVDDEHMMFWSMAKPSTRSFGQGRGTDAARATPTGRSTAGTWEYLPDTSDWLGKWRITQNKANDYLVDRDAQKNNRSYTGIPGIHQQDQALTESMGPIMDRTKEHLGTSDVMVIQTRRRLMNAARALRDEGVAPSAVDSPELYRVRSGGVVLPRSVNWLEGTSELRKAFMEHAGLRP